MLLMNMTYTMSWLYISMHRCAFSIYVCMMYVFMYMHTHFWKLWHVLIPYVEFCVCSISVQYGPACYRERVWHTCEILDFCSFQNIGREPVGLTRTYMCTFTCTVTLCNEHGEFCEAKYPGTYMYPALHMCITVGSICQSVAKNAHCYVAMHVYMYTHVG